MMHTNSLITKTFAFVPYKIKNKIGIKWHRWHVSAGMAPRPLIVKGQVRIQASRCGMYDGLSGPRQEMSPSTCPVSIMPGMVLYWHFTNSPGTEYDLNNQKCQYVKLLTCLKKAHNSKDKCFTTFIADHNTNMKLCILTVVQSIF
jgi:hypothetical protein